MRRLAGGRVPTPYNDEFFFWWHRHVIAIDEYPYAGIDYRGDPDIHLPPGFAYGDIVMKSFYIFHFLCFFKKNKKFKCFCMVSSIKNYFVTQMWVRDNQMDSRDIDVGTEDMSM
jgi:hypothetical protein